MIVGFAETFKALSDPVRREILVLLKDGKLSAGEIAGCFEMTQATVSYHLSKLKQADLICAYIKAQFELEHGNHEFKTAKKRLENLMEQWHSQEMDYFLQVFLPSFGRSIDEIAL